MRNRENSCKDCEESDCEIRDERTCGVCIYFETPECEFDLTTENSSPCDDFKEESK